jgi:hypothetical protein
METWRESLNSIGKMRVLSCISEVLLMKLKL